MNTKILFFNVFMLLSIVTFAQSKVANFTSLEIDGPVVIELVAGTTNEVVATKEADLVRWEVNGESLVIIAQHRRNHDTPEVRVTIAQLESLETTGAVVLKGEGVFAHRKLELTVTSQSVVSMEVDAETLEVTARDQSILNLEGAADDFQLNLRSQSIVNAKQVDAGLIDVTAREQSIARIKGNGAKVTKNVSEQSMVLE